jgi:hypothetical protein
LLTAILREGSEEVIRGEGAGGAAELIIPETATVRTREDFPKFHGNCPEPKPIFLDGLNIGDKVGDEVASAIGAVNLKEGGDRSGRSRSKGDRQFKFRER